ncbi:hypothetical protein GIB67_033062 [Kingdonia uniflora]|uniref:Protein kinase domain-containing protein n=1 Tax=Kingdonia uniflora TaxID=39325 RepID=A0A7J7MZ59_9MAGN|nr:hypothetical protein GIB67_033062 [Kingdonia uniflora]
MGIHEERYILLKTCHNSTEGIKQLFEEAAIALEIRNHKNIMKFLGCCLETKVVLVYECQSKRRLSNLLHDPKGALSSENIYSALSWGSKLRIATEIADAVTYMHISTSTPIIHRDIKSSNIFLDNQNVTKLFGFDHSLKMPLGDDHVEADVAGTVGYLAPEYCIESIFTEMCDVYGFGVLLLEILTEKIPLYQYYDKEYFDKGHSASCGQSSFNEDDQELNGSSVDKLNLSEIKSTSDCSSCFAEVNVDDELHVLAGETSERDQSKREGKKYIRHMSKKQVIQASLEVNILSEGETKQLMACITLAWQCRKDNPTKRPSMKELTEELRRIKTIKG